MRPTLKTGWRAALALLGLGLAALSLSQIREHRDIQGRLENLARRSGVLAHDPGIPQSLAREPDPWRARLRLARALLASATEAGEASEPGRTGPDGLDLTLRRLDAARSLASRVAVERPASWEAAMVQGAATYVGWSLRRDRRLVTHPEEWEAPLLRALKLAPGRPEPARFLAAAYLELWPALSRGKRETARALLARSMGHRQTFEALIELWLRTARSAGMPRAEAFAALPAEPWVWERMQQIASRDADWPAYVEARRLWYAAQETRLRRNLAEAEARLRGGDEVRAREIFLAIMQAPPRHRFLPALERALAQCPPGPAGSPAPAVRAWLGWSLDLCSWRSCPMPEPMLRRLADLAGDIEAPAAAHAALVAGDLAQGEVYERRAESTFTEPWGPYLIARAAALTRRRELDDADRALDTVHPAWRSGSLYWQARLALARAAGNGIREAEALRRLEELRRTEWTYRDWTLQERAPRLEIVPAAPAPGFTLEVIGVPDAGAGVEVRLDGEVIAMEGVRRGQVLTLRTPLDARPHLLEIEAVSGGHLVPGAVRLLAGS